ncbi:MAG: HlyD family efflux transporter periplasmic adaptor subunit [Hyphomicrobiaceae bacterium]
MAVKRERPDQRRHHRVTAPFFVTFDGTKYRVTDWSLGGFLVTDVPQDLPELGEELAVQCTLPFQGFEVSFDVICEVVRLQPERRGFAGRFVEVGERERELMSHFLDELVRGSMSEVADTIQRIDVPVTPASLEPKRPTGMQGLPVRRWPVKAVLMTAFYGFFGLGLFSYAGLLVYSNFYRMEVQSAVISAPIETVSSQVDGRIQWTTKKPGDSVKSGEMIVKVIDNQLEREIELADIAVKERRAQLSFLQRRKADEYERMKGFTTVETRDLEQAKIDVESVVAQLQAAEQQYGRLAILHRKGFATDMKLEESEKLVATLKKSLERKNVEFKSRVELAGQTDGRWHFTGQNMVGELGQLDAQVKLAESDVQLAQQKHQALINHKTRIAARAPFDGTLLELPHVDHGAVKRGDVIAIIEQRKQREVTAFLNQDEVVKVGLGDEVLLYMPALGETLKGRIRQIDRTSGFVKEQGGVQNPGYRWRGSTDRSAKVTIGFSDPTKVADVDKYRSGLPVVVVFPQRTTRTLNSMIGQKLSGTM